MYDNDYICKHLTDTAENLQEKQTGGVGHVDPSSAPAMWVNQHVFGNGLLPQNYSNLTPEK